MSRLLITGGTGYIGSHTAITLANMGHEVFLLDNLSNSEKLTFDTIKTLTDGVMSFFQGDIRDYEFVEKAIRESEIEAVIHFAGAKAVAESVKNPLAYFSNNVEGTLCLLRAMSVNRVKRLVFSSSATVYGSPDYLPFDEKHPRHPVSPYGESKLFVERILSDVYRSDNNWSILSLRYFNPVGAHESGLIGESYRGKPNNLMPYIVRVASGKSKHLSIFGGDYPTKDGTGIRDYIHVSDVAEGHLTALEYVLKQTGYDCVNLGTGVGYSVLDVVRTFEKVNGVSVPFEIVAKRPGDIAEFYSDSSRAEVKLGWVARRSLEDMCQSSWNFHRVSAHNKYKSS